MVSREAVQPISGSTSLGVGSLSSTHRWVMATPDCMAVLAGLKMRTFIGLHSLSGGVVGAAGFEPTTFCAQGRRATRLRYAPPQTLDDAGVFTSGGGASKAQIPMCWSDFRSDGTALARSSLVPSARWRG